MTVLITGATSMIGLALERELIKRGHQIIAVARRESEELKELTKQGSLRTILCDMRDYSHITETLSWTVDTAVLLAWNGTRGGERNNKDVQQKNVEQNLALIEELFRLDCKKILTAGSQAEYGVYTECITEESECRPNTEYGKAKLTFYREASKLCAKYGAVCIEPRFFSLYGPNDYPDTLVMSTLRKLMNGEECLFTEGIQMWDYLHIDDACTALAALCEDNSVSGGIYNFGSGDVRQLKDYILEMNEIIGGIGKLRFGAVPYPRTGMVSLCPDVSKLKTTAKWSPKITFREGITAILKSMHEDQKI